MVVPLSKLSYYAHDPIATLRSTACYYSKKLSRVFRAHLARELGVGRIDRIA